MSSPSINGRFFWVGFLTALYTALFGSLALLFTLCRCPQAWLDMCSRNWARWLLKASGMRVKFEGLEYLPTEPVVMVGNHQGLYDILVLLAYLPRPPVFVAKHTLFRVPIFGQAMKAVGHIPIDRSNSQKAIASIQKGTQKLLEKQQQVVFFPEGTRTRDGSMKPFKKGAFVFAIESGLPILPLAIEGSYRALPPKTKLIRPGIITIRILPPIQSADYTMEQRDELLQKSHQEIALAVTELTQAQTETLTSAQSSSQRIQP